MSANLPIEWADKKNSPLLADFIAKYGAEYCMTAEEINQLKNAVNEMAVIQQSTFLGAAEPTFTPAGTGRAYWIAVKPGTYANHGNVVVAANEIAFIIRDASGAYSISKTGLDFAPYLKIVDADLNYAKKANGQNKISKSVATINLFDSAVGFINAATGITGISGNTNIMKLALNKINCSKNFRMDIVFTTNAVTSGSKLTMTLKNKSLSNVADLNLIIDTANSTGQFGAANTLSSSGLVPGLKLQYSIIGHNGLITQSLSNFNEWDGNIGSGYQPAIAKKIFALTKLNTDTYLSVSPFFDLDYVEISSTNGNEFIVNSINISSDSIEVPNFPVNTIFYPRILNDSKDRIYPPMVIAKGNSNALAQWHHPNGYQGNNYNSSLFSALFNSGIATCFLTGNSYNNPAGTPLYGAGVTASNWGSPIGMKYRKNLMDFTSATLKTKSLVSIGVSMGGLNALAYSSLYNDNISCIVSISGAIDLVANFNNGSFQTIIKKAYGSGYVCIADNTGVATTDTTKWTKISNEKSAPNQVYYDNNPFYDTYSATKAYVAGDVVFVNYLGVVAGLAEFSPLNNGNKLSQIPTLLIHGDADTLIPIAQSTAYYNYIVSKGGFKIEMITVPGGTHLSADTFKAVEIVDFINRYI